MNGYYVGLGMTNFQDQSTKKLAALTNYGVLRWSVNVDGQITDIAVGSDIIYAITDSGRIYAVHEDDELEWEYSLGKEGLYELIVGKEFLLAYHFEAKSIYLVGDSNDEIGESDVERETEVASDPDQKTATSSEENLTQTPTVMMCPSALAPRLQVGKYAYVALEPPLPNLVRLKPGKDHAAVGQIPAGGVMEILDGPECKDDYIWWRVRARDIEIEGWTVEGDSQSYWLIPCENNNCD